METLHAPRAVLQIIGSKINYNNESQRVISNNVAFRQVLTQKSLCSLLLSLETQNDVRSVA